MSQAIGGFEDQLRADDAAGAARARVSVRRTRALLAMAADHYDADWVWLVRRELRFLDQAIGDVLDAVALRGWVAAQALDERDDRARSGLVDELTHERGRAHCRLVALLDSARYERMLHDLERPYALPEEPRKVAWREWRQVRVLSQGLGTMSGPEHLHRLATKVDRTRHAAELCKSGRPWADALAEARDALDVLGRAALTKGWLRHAASTPGGSWDLVAGQLIERARGEEAGWTKECVARLERAGAKDLRAWLKKR